MNFTYKNHLKYFINGNLYGYRTNPYEKFTVTIGQIDQDLYKQSNWLEEQYRTANIIANEYGKDFVLMFSGGTDSEIVLRSFLKIGIIPRVVFIKFTNDYNIGDCIEAKKVTDSLGVDLEIIDFDIIDFYKSGKAFEFASEIQCRQLAYLTVYFNIQKMQLPAVMGGEMLFQRQTSINGGKWYYCFRENQDGSAMRFSTKYNLPLVNEWFSYTPEMMGYYLEHPRIQWLFNERYNYKLSSFSTKNEVLKTYMPDLIDKQKTHGYEKLLGVSFESFYTLHKSHIKRLESSLDGLYIDELKKQLFGDNYEHR